MKWVTSAVLILSLIACAGGPAPRPAPEWISSPPQPDAGYFYFTGSGTSRENDQPQAEGIARGALIDEIMRYIGVKVTSDTTAVAKASIDSFKTDVTQTITQAGSGRIGGLEIADKYVEKRGAGTTVYLLARYNKNDLAKEKKRIEDLFAEQQQAVSGPEREARDLEGAGSHYAAAVKYIEAAAAAAKSGLDNAGIKFERNINSAKEALGRIALVKLNDNLSTAVGTPFSEPFTLKVVAGATSKDPGVPGVALTASYTEIKNNRKQVRAVSLKTDAGGIASFTYPVPDFVGPEKVTMMIDLGAYLEPLGSLPKQYSSMVGGLEDLAADKRAVFNLSTFSMAREIETGLAVASLDDEGNPAAGRDLASGIMKSLSDARFTVKALAIDPALIAGQADADVITAMTQSAGPSTARAIFAVAEVAGSETEGDTVLVKVSGTAKVADLKTGTVLLTVSRNKSALGKSPAAAKAAAFQQLGQDMGAEIANKLR